MIRAEFPEDTTDQLSVSYEQVTSLWKELRHTTTHLIYTKDDIGEHLSPYIDHYNKALEVFIGTYTEEDETESMIDSCCRLSQTHSNILTDIKTRHSVEIDCVGNDWHPTDNKYLRNYYRNILYQNPDEPAKALADHFSKLTYSSLEETIEAARQQGHDIKTSLIRNIGILTAGTVVGLSTAKLFRKFKQN